MSTALPFEIKDPWTPHGSIVKDCTGATVAVCETPEKARLIAQAPAMYKIIALSRREGDLSPETQRAIQMADGRATVPDGR